MYRCHYLVGGVRCNIKHNNDSGYCRFHLDTPVSPKEIDKYYLKYLMDPKIKNPVSRGKMINASPIIIKWVNENLDSINSARLLDRIKTNLKELDKLPDDISREELDSYYSEEEPIFVCGNVAFTTTALYPNLMTSCHLPNLGTLSTYINKDENNNSKFQGSFVLPS